MTHEGRMRRGELKISKGIKDSETEYFLANKEKPKEDKPVGGIKHITKSKEKK